jgi:hypothetical protein
MDKSLGCPGLCLRYPNIRFKQLEYKYRQAGTAMADDNKQEAASPLPRLSPFLMADNSPSLIPFLGAMTAGQGNQVSFNCPLRDLQSTSY